MAELTDEIQTEIDSALKDIATEAVMGNLKAVENLTKKAAELRAMKDHLEAIRSRLRILQNGHQGSTFSATVGIHRQFEVNVTQGMLNQNLLTLSDPVRHGKIRVGETLSIEALPSGDCFQTELLGLGNKLRERGKIGRFYRDAGVRAGDVIMLTEITPGQWQLKKRV